LALLLTPPPRLFSTDAGSRSCNTSDPLIVGPSIWPPDSAVRRAPYLDPCLSSAFRPRRPHPKVIPWLRREKRGIRRLVGCSAGRRPSCCTGGDPANCPPPGNLGPADLAVAGRNDSSPIRGDLFAGSPWPQHIDRNALRQLPQAVNSGGGSMRPRKTQVI